MDEHPVTGGQLLILEQPDVDDPANAADVDAGEMLVAGLELHDLAGDAEAHRDQPSFLATTAP